MSDVKRVIREGLEYWDRICELKRYGFIHSQDNSRVLKVEGIGSWIDMYEAQNVVDAAQHEINDLKAENESLRKVANELRRFAMCEHLHHDKIDQHEYDQPCKVLARIDSALNSSPENPS